MDAAVEGPAYVLVDEGTREVLVAGDDVSGFFVDLESGLPDVVFHGVRQSGDRPIRTDDAVLRILDRRGTKIGEYFVGRAVRRAPERPSAGGAAPLSVSFRSFGNRCEYVGAGKIWREWASDVEPALSGWLRWPVDYQEDWLHVVQNSWFARGYRAGRYGVGEVVFLDGAEMHTRAGFYCALGEAVNGPRGYFGANLDALGDCLAGSAAEGRLSRIVWRDLNESSVFLGRSFVDSVIRLMREFDVEVGP